MYVPKSPFVLCLELTSQCNLSCPHCVVDANPIGKKFPPDKVISIIDEAQHIGVKELVFGGGEVLLYDRFFEICKYTLSNGLNLSFTTNGILVPSVINHLINLKNYNAIFRVGVSLDGYTPEMHGYFRPKETFESAVEAIKLLVEADISVHVLCLLTKANINYMEEFLKFITELNVSDVRFIPLMPEGRAKRYRSEMITPTDFHNLIKEKQKWSDIYKIYIGLHMPWEFLFLPTEKRLPAPCEAGYLRLWMNSDGDMFPCAYMPNFIVGNIYRDSISNVWQNSPTLTKLRDSTLLKGACSTCNYRNSCRGGCRGLAQFLEGDYLCADPYCPIANRK